MVSNEKFQFFLLIYIPGGRGYRIYGVSIPSVCSFKKLSDLAKLCL